MSIGYVRTPYYRAEINGDQGFLLGTEITQNEALEDLTTMVVDAEVVNFHVGLATAKTLTIYQGGLGSVLEMAQFTGYINSIAGTSYPNVAKITGVGELSKLRRAPLGDHDLTGLTDGAAVRYILSQCAVDFVDADIDDYGYVLGALEPIKWLRGTAGADMIREIDRVFGMATMEIGNGRVVRFAYDKAPGAAQIGAVYAPGVNAWLYNVERNRGDLDSIQNFWQVAGLSYRAKPNGAPAGESDDSCQAQVYGEATASHPKFPTPGTYVAPESFQSDIIQSEALAKVVVRRLMRWNNREPDQVVIETANDPRVTPGDVIGVRDPAYGVDLRASQTATPYLVLSVDRAGDLMTLHCVGGLAGDEGEVQSGVQVCCGTQREDGTCDETGDDGPSGPDPGIGGPPDPDLGPLTPPDEADPGLPPPSDEPYVCDDLNEGGAVWISNGTDLGLRSYWRPSGIDGEDWDIETPDGTFPLDGGELVYRLAAPDGTGTLTLSTVDHAWTDPDDFCYGPEPSISVCADVAFCERAHTFTIGLYDPDSDVLYAGVTWYADPGLSLTIGGVPRTFNGQITLEHGSVVSDLSHAPSEISNGGLHRNTGAFFPNGGGPGLTMDSNPYFNGPPLDSSGVPNNFHFHNLCAAIDLGGVYNTVWASGTGGEQSNKSEKCISATCDPDLGDPLTYPVCTHDCHALRLRGSGLPPVDETFADFCPNVQVRNLAYGQSNCVPNPNYVPPEERDPDAPDYVP